MDKITIDTNVISKNRAVINNYFNLGGRQIFKASSECVDLKFGENSQRAKDSGGIMPSRPVRRYPLSAVDIAGAIVTKDAADAPVLILNPGFTNAKGEDISIRCPLVDDKFTKDVTVETVKEAIKNGKVNPVYFSNPKRLAEELNALNTNELRNVNALIHMLEQQKSALEQTIQNNIARANEYYAELNAKNSRDGESGSTVEGHVHIEA